MNKILSKYCFCHSYNSMCGSKDMLLLQLSAKFLVNLHNPLLVSSNILEHAKEWTINPETKENDFSAINGSFENSHNTFCEAKALLL